MGAARAFRFGVIADDLTGACDAGVQFARRGFSTVVLLDRRAARAAEVIVLSTGSRADSPYTARRKVREACRRLQEWDARLIYKKIDSTLRGNVIEEIRAAMEATGRSAAVMTPAFPAMGRTVVDGSLRVAGQAPRAIPVEERIAVADAAAQADLERLVREAFAARPGPLLAGSAGLAIELARLLAERQGKTARVRQAPRLGRGPALLFVGSTNPATAAQVVALEARRGRALARGRIVCERVRRAGTDVRAATERVRELVAGAPAGLFVTGGDTAQLVFRALDVEAVRLVDEVSTGVAWGWIEGGLAQGLPVVTKAGGFGNEKTLVRIADFLAPDCATVEA